MNRRSKSNDIRLLRAWLVALCMSGLVSACEPADDGRKPVEDPPVNTDPSQAATIGGFPAEWFKWTGPEEREAHLGMIGKPAPKLTLTDWTGDKVDAGDFKGRITIVDFWATWCIPCIAAMPANEKLYQQHKDKGLTIIGVCDELQVESRQKWIDKQGVTYPIATDVQSATARAWNVVSRPTYAIVDAAGIVRAIGIKHEHVEDVVDRLFAEHGNGNGGGRVEIDPKWLAGTPADRAALADLENRPPPPLKIDEWFNGEALNLDDLKGKVVLLDFWATWCAPCVAAIPAHNQLAAKYVDQGLVMIGICHSRGAEKMVPFADEKGIIYPVAADDEGQTYSAYRVAGPPAYYLIDRAGRLRIAHCRPESLEQAVSALLSEPQPH